MSEQTQQTGSPKGSILDKIKAKINKKTMAIAGGVLALLIAGGVLALIQPWAEWVVKIGGEKVTLSDFNNLYYMYNGMNYPGKSNADIDKMSADQMELARNPLLSKEEFLRQFITSRVIYQKAAKDGFATKDEVLLPSESQKWSTISRFYFARMLKDKIAVTDKEIEDAYMAYQSQLKGMPLDEAMNRLRYQLMQQKLYAEQGKIIREMRENARIERDELLMAKLLDPDKSKQPTSGTLVTIDGSKIKTKKISVKEFNTLYYSLNRVLPGDKNNEVVDKLASDPISLQINPLLNKKDFLDEIITQYIVYSNIMLNLQSDKEFSAKSLKIFSSLLDEQSIGISYIKETKASEFVPSEAEVESEYEKNKAQFANFSKDIALFYVGKTLYDQSFARKFSEIATKIRESVLVEKNEEVTKSFAPKPAADQASPAAPEKK